MSYVDSLEVELAAAGIPARRRARIVAEFSDHLHENPEAELGAPRDLARQFADELGTRLARGTAYRAFAALAVAAIVLVVMFFNGGRTWGGWVGYGYYPVSYYFPWWWVPMMIVCFISAQVALASGGLALLRAWRLRRVPVMTAADAAILNRRAAVGLVSGAITMTVLPLTHFVVGVDLSTRWNTVAGTVGPALIVLLLAMLPDVLRAAPAPDARGPSRRPKGRPRHPRPARHATTNRVGPERRDRAGDGRDRCPQQRPVRRDPPWPVRRGGMPRRIRGPGTVSGASAKRRRLTRGLGHISDLHPSLGTASTIGASPSLPCVHPDSTCFACRSAGRECCNVAQAATRSRLLLWNPARPKEKRTPVHQMSPSGQPEPLVGSRGRRAPLQASDPERTVVGHRHILDAG